MELKAKHGLTAPEITALGWSHMENGCAAVASVANFGLRQNEGNMSFGFRFYFTRLI